MKRHACTGGASPRHAGSRSPAPLPGDGCSEAAGDDGSGTPPGASTHGPTSPWGAGYVKSEPDFVDCPLACIRPPSQDGNSPSSHM